MNLGRSSLDYLLKETSNRARVIANAVADAEGGPGPALARAAEQAGVYEAALYAPSGSVLAVAGLAGSMTPEPLSGDALRLARLQQTYAKVETQDAGVMLRVVVPVNSSDRLDPLRVLQVIERVPRALAQDIEKVQAGQRDYQEISFSRAALKRLYQLTLALTLLLALTSALGLAVVLSERFAEPLGLLAEGTRAVAQGDFTRRQPVVSRDELGVLTESFNTMTAQLAEAQGKAEDSRRATETTRAYLESVLATRRRCAGFDDRYRLRTANPSAAVLLAAAFAEPRGFRWRNGAAGCRRCALQRATVRGLARRATDSGSARRVDGRRTDADPRCCAARDYSARLFPDIAVVFDDVSELLQAQRDAAWRKWRAGWRTRSRIRWTPIQLSGRTAGGQSSRRGSMPPNRKCCAQHARSCRRSRRWKHMWSTTSPSMPGSRDLGRCRVSMSRGSCSTCSLLYDNLQLARRPALPGRTRHHPG